MLEIESTYRLTIKRLCISAPDLISWCADSQRSSLVARCSALSPPWREQSCCFWQFFFVWLIFTPLSILIMWYHFGQFILSSLSTVLFYVNIEPLFFQRSWVHQYLPTLHSHVTDRFPTGAHVRDTSNRACKIILSYHVFKYVSDV